MAQLHNRKDRGGKWELDYTDVDGKRYRIPTGTSDRKVAELWLRKAEEILSQAKLGLVEKVGRIDANVIAGKEKKKKSLTLEELKTVYEDRARHDLELAENSIELNNMSLKSFIGSAGNKRLSDLSAEDVRQWKRKLVEDGRSKTTLSIYHRHLRAIFNRTMKWKMIDINPFDQVEISRGRRKEAQEKNMAYEEVVKLLKTIDDSGDHLFGLFVRFVLYTACRRNEILFLQYEDIDLEAISITVRPQKTGKLLELPINKALKRVIDGMEIRQGYIFQTQSQSRGAAAKKQPWHQDFVTHKFKKYVRTAGLPEHYTLHSLRHTYATHLRKQGVPLDIVQRLLGHASSRTTEDNYDHSVALHFRAQADLVDFEGQDSGVDEKEGS